jgi:mono/diheme cytochrome c family protein
MPLFLQIKKNGFFLALGLGLSAAPFVLHAQSKPVPAKAGIQASMTRGKQVYLEQCLSCHQVDFGGVQGMNPPLIKTTFVLGDKAALVKIVLNGMQGALDINGDTYHNVMAPHSDLTDQQIADVLTYVRNNFGNKASAITPAQVKAVRAANSPGNKPKTS